LREQVCGCPTVEDDRPGSSPVDIPSRGAQLQDPVVSRLSSVDSSFLRVESANAHMHVGWMSLLELPPAVQRFDLDELRRRIAGRLHLLPRFRQRITPIPR